MPSEEHDSRPTDLILATSDAQRRFVELAEAHRKSCGEDCLYAFLKIHECIFDRVSALSPVPIRELNLLFALRCVQVYEDYQNNRYRQISKRWITAFLAYQNDRYAFFKVLPLMAFAHIMDDLELTLAEVEVEKSDYDLVLDDIVFCIANVNASLNLPGGIKQRVFDFLQARFGAPTISAFREIAWKSSLRRKRLRPSNQV